MSSGELHSLRAVEVPEGRGQEPLGISLPPHPSQDSAIPLHTSRQGMGCWPRQAWHRALGKGVESRREPRRLQEVTWDSSQNR